VDAAGDVGEGGYTSA